MTEVFNKTYESTEGGRLLESSAATRRERAKNYETDGDERTLMEQHHPGVGAFGDEKRAQRRGAVARRTGEQSPPHLRHRDALVRGERGHHVIRVARVASLGRIRRRARKRRRRANSRS